VVGDRWLGAGPFVRDSLSAYYYSGVRELFVGVLSAIGVFVFTYKVADHSLDNTLTLLAAVAVVAVVLFPTGLPAHVAEPTPLQEKLGETWVQTIHFVGAFVFIVSLAVISLLYGVREGRRPAQQGRRPPLFWRWYHWVAPFSSWWRWRASASTCSQNGGQTSRCSLASGWRSGRSGPRG
jgi:hypothetical protein